MKTLSSHVSKKLLLPLLVVAVSNVFAQYPLPKPSDNPVWTYIETDLTGFGGIDYLFQIRYNGDTIINGISYNILERKNSFSASAIHAFIRQDSISRSVWIISEYLGETEEKLLVSLNAAVGDTLVFNGMYHYLNDLDSVHTLDSVRLVMGSDGIQRNRYFFTPLNTVGFFGFPYYTLSIIEGVGFTNQPFGPSFFNLKSTYHLYCLRLDGELVHSDFLWYPPSIDCDYFGVVSSKNTESKNQFNIYPNPTSGIFSVVSGSTLSLYSELRIYNFSGQMVYEEKLSESPKTIDVSFLPKGLYYLSLISENKSYNQKLILTK